MAQVLGLDPDEEADRARIVAMIRTRISTGVLDIEEIHCARNSRKVNVVRSGSNDPSVESSS